MLLWRVSCLNSKGCRMRASASTWAAVGVEMPIDVPALERHRPLQIRAITDCLPKPTHTFWHINYYYCYFYYTLFLPETRCVCRQAACESCQNPTPCWTRQIQARPNQPWARCSIFVPPLASRGQLLSVAEIRVSVGSQTVMGFRGAVCNLKCYAIVVG